MSDGKPFTPEQRRFPRLSVPRPLCAHLAPLEAKIVWPNYEMSDLIDVSYRGFAARPPAVWPSGASVATAGLEVDERLSVNIELGLEPSFAAVVRIAYFKNDGLGLELLDVQADGRSILNRYVEAQLMGLKMKSIAPTYFSPNDTFQRWVQGPHDSHVFLWMAGDGGIERARVIVADETTDFAIGQSSAKPSAKEARALLILSQMDKTEVPMEDFLRSLKSFGV